MEVLSEHAVRFVKQKFSMKVTERVDVTYGSVCVVFADREAKVTVFARFQEKQRCHILLAIFSRLRQKFLSPGFTVVD